MIREGLLAKILKGRIVLFDDGKTIHRINDIYFDDGVVSSVDEENLIYVDKNELEQFIESYQKLEKENEQLKQYIYDNIDENICDVCSYQYLEKHSQMQGYYVAKCKKGYDNCSKGTVIHCKDFKFKELNVND